MGWLTYGATILQVGETKGSQPIQDQSSVLGADILNNPRNDVLYYGRSSNYPQRIQLSPDDGGHDVIDNFEFPCISMENLISIWNFTNTVTKNVK